MPTDKTKRPDALFMSIIRVLVSQNEIVDMSPIVKEDLSTKKGKDSLVSFIMGVSDEDFDLLMALVRHDYPEKFQEVIAAARKVYNNFETGMSEKAIEEMITKTGSPVVSIARNILVRALSFGVADNDARVWAFNVIADTLTEADFPQFMRIQCVSWICSKVFADAPTLTAGEIRASIEKEIAGHADGLATEGDYSHLKTLCQTATEKGYEFDEFWPMTSPYAAAHHRALEDFICRAERKEIAVEEFQEFIQGDIMRSACMRIAMARCWPK